MAGKALISTKDLVRDLVCDITLPPNAFTASGYKDLIFIDRVSITTAVALGHLPYEKHSAMLSTIDKLPLLATDYDWLQFRTPSGKIVVLGEAWIAKGSLRAVGSTVITVVITGENGSRITDITNALEYAGISNFTVTTN